MWWIIACAAPAPAAPFTLTPIAEVKAVTAVTGTPAGPNVLLLAEQAGRVWWVAGGRASTALDFSDRVTSGGELGLLGLAVHPKWPEDPRVFVNYTRTVDGKLSTRVVSFVLPASGVADPASEVEVLAFPQPYRNHNSGALAFGPDGMLYIGVGDGGAGGDPLGTGQDRSDWLGSILRVDVSTPPYRVPADNPFVGVPNARPEVWAYGVRNPWGMGFDGSTLWFADVGQNRWEEVNIGVAGANYGWNRMEGTHCFGREDCDRTGLTLPVVDYGRELGQSVTGGRVYRGPSIPALDGKYVFADFGSGVFLTVEPGRPATVVHRSSLHPSAFGTDRQGRLYVADYGSGVYRLDP